MKMQPAANTRAEGRPIPRTPARRRAVKAGARQPATEIELKFRVPALAYETLIQALEDRQCGSTRLQAHYYDTDDGRLAAAGMSLRLRQEGRQWFQTLKIAGEGGIYERQEHEVKIPGARNGSPPAPDIGRHAGTPAGESLEKLLHRGGQAPKLAERYATDVLRRSCDLTEGDARIEVAFDQGVVRAGDREEAIGELEFELKSGDPKTLCSLARTWIGRYGLWLSSESKSARGKRLAAAAPMPVVKASPPRLDPAMPGEAALRATTRSCIDQILPNATAIAAGSRDHDHVHQLRVGLRRLRTAMREMGDLSRELDPAWEAPLAEAFRQLGSYRDREAVLENLKPKLQKAGAPGIGWMKSEEETADPVAAVRDPLFQAALVDVLGFALGGGKKKQKAADGEELSRHLRRRLKSLHRKVADDGARFHHLSEPCQHRVRKRLKRLRYLSEFVSSLFGQQPVDDYLDGLRPAQDALGEHNDYAVAAAMARQAAGLGDPDADFAVDWLEQQQEKSAKASKQALRKIGDGERFWKRSSAGR